MFLLQFKLPIILLAIARLDPGALNIPAIDEAAIIVQCLSPMTTIPANIALTKTDQTMVRV